MTPSELLQLSGGYWSTCALHAAVKLDLFTHMDKGTLNASEIACIAGCNERGMEMLLDALSAMGLLQKHDGCYSSADCSREFLSKNSGNYLGYIILHHHHLMAGWNRLDEAVTSGAPVRENSSQTDSDIARTSFLMGMFNLASLSAPKIVPALEISGCRKLLDLGGGPGTYAIHFCLNNPDLKSVIFDFPTTQRFAEQTVARFGLSDRISFRAGDILTDEIGDGYNVVWISQLLHSEGPAGAELMLKKAVKALVPGGLVFVQEFILEDSRDAPLFPALFSLNMLIGTTSGQSYSQSDLARMMTEAGLHRITRLPVVLPNGAGIMRGVL